LATTLPAGFLAAGLALVFLRSALVIVFLALDAGMLVLAHLVG